MFTAKPLHRSLSVWPVRLVALGCAMLVGLLSLASSSPDLHASLHGEHQESAGPAKDTDHEDAQTVSGHSCAVALFSQGIDSGCTPLLELGAPEPLFTDVIALADQVARAARAMQLPPGRGPPVC